MANRYYDSPRWTAEIADCSMPMTFDTYSNCGFGCLYCFSQFQKSVGSGKESYLRKEANSVNVDRIRRIFSLESRSEFSDVIENRMVLQWGGLSDPFCTFERRYGKTPELLKIFRDLDYPICFSTKGVFWLDDPRYTELFKGADNWNCKFSIITGDKQFARKVEKGCPSPEKRIKAIEKYVKLNNGGATLRLRPFIIGISDGTFEQLITDCAHAGATALSTEFYCMEGRSILGRENCHEMSKIAGFDLYGFYKRYSCSVGYYRLNRNVKRQRIDKMEELCDKLGIRFYVSDAHFKERCHNGSCCGLPEHWNYSKGQFCEALMVAKRKGEVRWSDISPHLEYAKNLIARKAINGDMGRTEVRDAFWNHTMYDYLRYLWNHPKRGQSPYKLFEGVLRPSGRDEAGDRIYKIDKSRT